MTTDFYRAISLNVIYKKLLIMVHNSGSIGNTHYLPKTSLIGIITMYDFEMLMMTMSWR